MTSSTLSLPQQTNTSPLLQFDPTLLHHHYCEDIIDNLRDALSSRMPYNWLKTFSRFQIADDLLFVCTRFRVTSPDVKFNALCICIHFLQYQRYELKRSSLKNYFPIIYLSVAISIKYYLKTMLSFHDILDHLKEFGVVEGWNTDTLLSLEINILESLEYKVRMPHLWSFVYAMLTCFMSPLSQFVESTTEFVDCCQDAAEMLVLRSERFTNLNMCLVVATVVSCGNMLYHLRHNWKYDTGQGVRCKCLVSTWIAQVTTLKRKQVLLLGEKLFSFFDVTQRVHEECISRDSSTKKKSEAGTKKASSLQGATDSVTCP